jgi:hypothetical protein
MGCSSSLPEIEREQEVLLKQTFNYSDNDISHLFSAFRKIDLTKSRSIEFDEFCVRLLFTFAQLKWCHLIDITQLYDSNFVAVIVMYVQMQMRANPVLEEHLLLFLVK